MLGDGSHATTIENRAVNSDPGATIGQASVTNAFVAAVIGSRHTNSAFGGANTWANG